MSSTRMNIAPRNFVGLESLVKYLKFQMDWQKDAHNRHLACVRNGDPSISDGHEALYNKYQSAYEELLFLRENNIEWVGDDEDLNVIIPNIHKIAKAIREYGLEVPPPETEDYYDYLQSVLDLNDEDDALKTKNNRLDIKRNSSSNPTNKKKNSPVLKRVAINIPTLVVGAGVGAGVRIAAQFAMAAFVTTTPGIVATIGSAMFVGALAGGVSKIVTTAFFDKEKTKEKNWKRKAFLKGAVLGGLAGGVGAGLVQYFADHFSVPIVQAEETSSIDVVDETVETVEVKPETPDVLTEGQDPVEVDVDEQNTVSAEEGSGAEIDKSPQEIAQSSESQSISEGSEQTAPVEESAVLEETEKVQQEVEESSKPQVVAEPTQQEVQIVNNEASSDGVETQELHRSVLPQEEVFQAIEQTEPISQPVIESAQLPKNLLSEQQINSLPKWVQNLAESEKAEDQARFCKEVSCKLLNTGDVTKEAKETAAKLLEQGVGYVKQAGLTGTTAEQLHADYAYVKAWGIGMEKDVPTALEHARQSGDAVRNFGQRLMNIFKVPTNG